MTARVIRAYGRSLLMGSAGASIAASFRFKASAFMISESRTAYILAFCVVLLPRNHDAAIGGVGDDGLVGWIIFAQH
jgi:hypothetical protein